MNGLNVFASRRLRCEPRPPSFPTSQNSTPVLSYLTQVYSPMFYGSQFLYSPLIWFNAMALRNIRWQLTSADVSLLREFVATHVKSSSLRNGQRAAAHPGPASELRPCLRLRRRGRGMPRKGNRENQPGAGGRCRAAYQRAEALRTSDYGPSQKVRVFQGSMHVLLLGS